MRAATLLGALSALVGPSVASDGGAEVVDRIAAVVNDEVVTLRDVVKAAGPLLASVAQIPDADRRERERARALTRTLDDLVGQRLVLQEARKLKLEATREEVDAWLGNLRRQYGWSEEELRQAIESQGATELQYRKDVRRRIVTNRVVQVKLGSSIRVSDQEVADAFRREFGDRVEEPEITARHILFLVAEALPDTDPAAVDKRAMAETVLAKLRAGADFAEMAAAHSEGPSAGRGGEIGAFKPGPLDPEFEKAALRAEVGEIVGPIRTRFGWHLIQVTRVRMVKSKDPSEAKAEIRARLRQQALERQLGRWVEELKRSAFVESRL